MRVAAVLTGLALAAMAPTESRAVKIADTMSGALGKMVSGVERFLTEAHDATAERSAQTFIDKRPEPVTQAELDAAEAKGAQLASQVVRNLKALQAAAKALQSAARETPTPPRVMSEGEQAGYVMALESKVAGQKKAIGELDEEKKSLVTSVASLMHRGDDDLKSQLAEARAKIVQLEEAANAAATEAASKAGATEDQLRSANSLLSQSLNQCQEERKLASAGQVEASVVTSEVKCKENLKEALAKLASSESEHSNLVQTVDMMVQSTDQLKVQLQAKANCTVPVVAPAPAAAPKGFDVAHMGETVKIDQYIATAGHPTYGNASVAVLAPIKPVRFKAASVKAASEALAGRGDIGKYLRGAKDDDAEAKSGANAALAAAAGAPAGDDATDLEQQIDSLMPEDVDVIKAADAVGASPKVRKQAHGDDNLAQKLLLQAEQALKLAA